MPNMVQICVVLFVAAVSQMLPIIAMTAVISDIALIPGYALAAFPGVDIHAVRQRAVCLYMVQGTSPDTRKLPKRFRPLAIHYVLRH